jgi:hypothetical protein
VAAYKAPSTTHVLAQLASNRVMRPLSANTSSASPEVVELTDDEARFGEDEDRENVSSRIRGLLGRYDVTILWEPHCEVALSLGARYVARAAYEQALKEFEFPLMYSAVVMSEALIRSNPTLPLRLRRALDRAVTRLQDPNRLRYCLATLNNRSLLGGFNGTVREVVLGRLVASVPAPADTVDSGVAGWNAVNSRWAEGIYATYKLRQSVSQQKPELAARLRVSDQHLTSVGECRRFIFSPGAQAGR